MEQDEYGFETHKLIYHSERVVQWLRDPFSVYPIYVEIAPTNNCNHRCAFCGCDFLGYKEISLDKLVLAERLAEMSMLGIKSIMYAGEGEPLLHKDIAEIINHTKKVGIDTAITTNGTPLTKKMSEEILGSISWLKVSIDAGTKETYGKLHGCPEIHFETALRNLKAAVEIRNCNKHNCTLGAQMLLLPENFDEVIILAQKLKDIGIDYFVIKPHSQYPLSLTKQYQDLSYGTKLLNFLEKQAEKISNHNFKVILRKQTMKKLKKTRDYKRCSAVPFFWAYVDAKGNVWTCSAYLTNESFFCGNIYQSPFEEIWQSKKRKKNMKFVVQKLNVSKCRQNCRMDEINRYLWKIKNPPEHANFI